MRDKTNARTDSWSIRVVLRYTLFQLPGWLFLILMLLLAHSWMDLSTYTVLAVIVLWIGKDIVMFPYVWRAYDANPSRTLPYRMIGELAVVKERLSPSGLVQVNGELWQAELLPGSAAVEKGQVVRVQDVRGLTLIIRPENNEAGID